MTISLDDTKHLERIADTLGKIAEELGAIDHTMNSILVIAATADPDNPEENKEAAQ